MKTTSSEHRSNERHFRKPTFQTKIRSIPVILLIFLTLQLYPIHSFTIPQQYITASPRYPLSLLSSPTHDVTPTLTPTSPNHTLFEIDVRYSRCTPLAYDPTLDRYLPKPPESEVNTPTATKISLITLPYLRAAFLPEHVQPSYYNYMKWRILQRYISAVVHVFGTQSLLLGLGQKNQRNLGLSAALSWVLKDALGKIVRMMWASQMGRKFDPDAKRWRFRSSLLFALGNLLEICAFINPMLFILYATLSNCLKQMSMLTSSATRNALYNSFKLPNRENIGDITAKGEAQIAVVDLLGIGMGVCLSKYLGVSIKKVLGVYFCLQSLEIWAMYKEITSVVFRVLNFERMYQLILNFLDATVQTPLEMAQTERIFLPPAHFSRREISFGSLGRAQLSPGELEDLTTIFRREKFLLVVGENVKRSKKIWRRLLFHRNDDPSRKQMSIQENCHIVLHSEAGNVDIVKSTLALIILRKKLLQCGDNCPKRTRYALDLIKQAREEANDIFPKLLVELKNKGWSTPAKFMFGRVSMRAEWPLLTKNRVSSEQHHGLESSTVKLVDQSSSTCLYQKNETSTTETKNDSSMVDMSESLADRFATIKRQEKSFSNNETTTLKRLKL